MKKKFKDTKVGGFLLQHAPEALDFVGDYFPPAKTLSRLVAPELAKLDADKRGEFYEILETSYEKERAYALENTNAARGIYGKSKEMADSLANRIMTWNLPVMGLLVIANIGCIMWLESTLLAVVSNVIGGLLSQLSNERTTVVNFFFGSSTGSKDKDNKNN